ncbi:hypothetical protein [Streptococcus equi]|uniref:hypothetical protein n=1 Tax=Streptococcus equi TaxID=1336 RepID=UPI0018C9D458|nr:hypothetical protein [Streptococcus equi]MCD3396600.1 hypothetical protein [Streptococcus equi subsp. zooepidemicus]MCD3427734.1 hypothetical protein [Streptococcus equi subsp. zooepidemicus]MCD3428360.1 hypothetical protein [Streptococcus equi subsp. zooepidemicus]MCD3428365.1 hypothetical protein [Streptococcus equi subsp. zooepidemicus]QTC12348.1 hypothetical protein HIEAAJJG_01102 [Streptococcus equi subsp. zooepidemicus]
MREVKQIIQDEMDYSLCKLLLDYLYFRKLIDEEKWIASSTEVKEKYDPPILMLEGTVWEKK